MKIGQADLVTTGRFVRITRIPESQEDYVDVEDPDAVIRSLQALRPRSDIFSFWQRPPETQPKFGYPMEWDNVAAIRVTSHREWLERKVHPSVRTKLRKADKQGVTVELMAFDDKLVNGMWRIFNETPVRQGRPFSHYGKTREQIRHEWNVDMSISVYIGARFEDELIGFVKLSFTDRYAELSGTICMLAHRDKPAMSALIARSVRFCEERGVSYLGYGRFTYGNKGEDSLSDFKRHNGFQKIEVPRYYVPLTLRGRLALKLGIHRDWSHSLPNGLLRKAIDLRTKYYRWRMASAR